jgi:ATP-binding cassette subfamily F protein 3
VLVISHDRDFLEGLCDKIYEFEKEGIREHLGGIEYFLDKKKLEDMRAFEKVEKVKEKKEEKPVAPTVNNDKQINQLKKQIGQVEIKIEKLEKEIAGIDAQLQIPAEYEKLTSEKDFFAKYDNLKKQLEEAFAEWSKLGEEMSALG